MNELFGIPMTTLTTVLVALLAVCLAVVAWIGWRRRVIFSLGIRNLPRRKAQTLLIVAGLMLSTLIITSALGVGDTIDHSITSGVYGQMGHVDLLVVETDKEESTTRVLDGSIPIGALEVVDSALAGSTDVDGVMPVLAEHVSVTHETAGLGEPEVLAIGLDPERIDQFSGIESVDGEVIDLAAMPSGSVALNETLAELLDAQAGDTVQLFVKNQPVEVTVTALVVDSFLTGTGVSGDDAGDEAGGLVMPLAELQALKGNSESLSAVAISNMGGVRDSVALTSAVKETLDPVLEGSGTAANPLKVELIDQAVMLGQVFAGLFLVVGLFSIAAGILLILLTFTMLAAERRAEMDMARAVGAQRGQLVQQFIS